LSEAQNATDALALAFNEQYLELQQQMQDENRQFSLSSEVDKSKHDDARNSIDNLR